MEKQEKILLVLAFVALVAVVIFNVAGNAQSDVGTPGSVPAGPSTPAMDAPSVAAALPALASQMPSAQYMSGGPAYLVYNQPAWYFSPPIGNVLPRDGANVSSAPPGNLAAGSCTTCGG